MHQSPLKQKQLRNLDIQTKELLHELQNLFTFYASRYDRLCYHELSQKGWNCIINELLKKEDKVSPSKSTASKHQPSKPELTKEQRQMELSLQLIYYSKGTAQMLTFQEFLNRIPKMAAIMFDHANEYQGTQMMNTELRYLYKRRVLNAPDVKLNGRLININWVLREDTLDYIGRLKDEFEKIYKVYFPHEINHNLKKVWCKDESLKNFFTFLKEFQIMPKLVTAGEAYFAYAEAIQNPASDCLGESQQSGGMVEKPILFTLGKFISCLVVIGRYCYRKIRQLQDTQQEVNEKLAFKALLQQIEMNKAYKNSRHLKQTNQAFSFIRLEEYPIEVELAKSRQKTRSTTNVGNSNGNGSSHKKKRDNYDEKDKKQCDFLRIMTSKETQARP